MPTKKKVMKRREFTPGTAKCIVVTIRAVFDMSNFTTDKGDATAIDRLLEEARSYGAAEVIERMAITEDFEKACNILRTQRVRT